MPKTEPYVSIVPILAEFERRILARFPRVSPNNNADLRYVWPPTNVRPIAEHLLYCARRIVAMQERGERLKAARWFGFVQGAMWVLQWVSVVELKTLTSQHTTGEARVVQADDTGEMRDGVGA